ncbi:hypothetical protein F3Y22_tig00002237pilonHSYRG00765 [Hibiscus syriacus]|uniref:Uncharacterized protein n=1 Tax=Hibiscus syriacus TaxID=106335 RepID=A0A6A3CUP6_HIBSY|nr:hypothetical protein F3Y22_tig00002237pilonHSYRG00765 [Hibiscus syriacus]
MSPKNHVNVRRHKKKLWIEHWDTVSGLVINEENGIMYSVSWDKSFKISNVKARRCTESVKAHEDAVNALVVSDDGTVYTGGADRGDIVLDQRWGLVSEWVIRSDGQGLARGKEGDGFQCCLVLEEHERPVKSLVAVAGSVFDGVVSVCSGNLDGEIRVWEISTCSNFKSSKTNPMNSVKVF